MPGMLGVSHGALQFMTYEEMKNWYNKSRHLPIDAKMVSKQIYDLDFVKYKNKQVQSASI